MFNFLKIFQKEKKQDAIELEIKIENAFSKIKELEDKLFSETYQSTAHIQKETISAVKKLAESATALGKSEIRGEIDPRLKKRVEEAKAQIANKTALACRTVVEKTSDFKNFSDIVSFIEDVNRALHGINVTGARQAEFAGISFKREMDNLGSHVKTVKQKIISLGEIVKSEEQRINAFEESKSIAKRISEMLLWITEMEHEKENKTHEIEKLSKETVELSKKRGELESSSEYKNAVSERSKIGQLREELHMLKISFRGSFGLIDKTLRKYLHDNPSANSAIAALYLSEPLQGLASDEKLEIIEVLLGLKIAVKDNKISIEEKMREKTIERISGLEKEMPKLQERIRRVNDEIERLSFSKFVLDNAEELKDRLTIQQKQIEALTFEIQRLGEEAVKKKEWISKAQSEMITKLGQIGVKLHLL